MNLSELDLLFTKMMSGENKQSDTSQDSANDSTFIVEERELVRNILSLSMVNSTINTQLASLRSLSCPDIDLLRPDWGQRGATRMHVKCMYN